MTNVRERYCGYILNIMAVGEEVVVKDLHNRLYDYNPNDYRGGQRRTFFHKDMPSRSQLSSILRISDKFENAGIRDNTVLWRRIE